MNTKQVLSIEQMQHLKDLGVDTSKASAYWYRIIQNKGDGNIRVISDWELTFSLNIACCTGHTLESVRTSTLQDILDLLPATVDDDYRLYIDKGLVLWTVGYVDAVSEDIYEDFRERDLIDAAYEMLCWCAVNGYIKTNKEE